MADAFEFTIPNPLVKLDENRSGTAVLDVISRLDRNAVVRVDVQGAKGTEPTWFGQPDPEEFTFPYDETLRVSVPINVPPMAPPGAYQFVVRAFAIENQQEEFASSPSFSVTVNEKPAKRSIPNWLIALLAALLLLVLLLIVYFAFFRDSEPGSSVGTFTDCADVRGVSPAECQSLVDLFRATNGEEWLPNEGDAPGTDVQRNWLKTNAPCFEGGATGWYGVACSGGNVTGIFLADHNLEGQVPASFVNLEFLQDCSLHGNPGLAVSGNALIEFLDEYCLYDKQP